jgi:hypothetical protein
VSNFLMHMKKPIDVNVLIDTIEDQEISEGLNMLMSSLTTIKTNNKNGSGKVQIDPTPDQVRDLFEGLRRIQKGRTF